MFILNYKKVQFTFNRVMCWIATTEHIQGIDLFRHFSLVIEFGSYLGSSSIGYKPISVTNQIVCSKYKLSWGEKLELFKHLESSMPYLSVFIVIVVHNHRLSRTAVAWESGKHQRAVMECWVVCSWGWVWGWWCDFFALNNVRKHIYSVDCFLRCFLL